MEGRRRKKKPLSRLAKTFLSYALIAALALAPQAAWAEITEGIASGEGAIAIGEDSSAGHMCTSVGSNALAGLQSSTFGYQANAEGTYSSAFGYQANAYATNSVALGANSVASEADTVSVGGSTQRRRIVNVADGTVAEGSTDAVTGGQLYSLGSEVARIVGGRVTYDGKFSTGAVVNIGGKDYNTIEEALNALYDGTAGSTGGAVGGGTAVQYDDDSKTSVTLNKSGDAVKLTNIADGKDDLDAVNKRQLDAVRGQVDLHKTTLEKHETTLNEHTVMIENHEEQFTTLQTVLGDTYSSPSFSSITVGNIYSDGTNINMGGGTITGLADGSIAPGSTDAVTGGQLWNAYKRMDDLNESINIVGAHAAALSGLHPIQYNPYEPTTLSAAVGTYRDEYAVAVGVFHYVRSNVLFNLGASICSDGDVMGRAGVSLAVGKGGKKKPELARDMVGMQQQMIAMQAMLEELKEENAKNKETIKKNEETIKELKEALGKKK